MASASETDLRAGKELRVHAQSNGRSVVGAPGKAPPTHQGKVTGVKCGGKACTCHCAWLDRSEVSLTCWGGVRLDTA